MNIKSIANFRNILSLLAFFTCINQGLGQVSDSLAFRKTKWTKEKLLNGVTWMSHHFQDSSIFNSYQNIHVLKVDSKKKNYQFAIVSAGDSLQLTSKLAKDHNAVGAINGSFFNVKSGGSVNLIKIDGELIDTSYTSKPGAYGFNQEGVVAFNKKDISILARDYTLGNAWENTIQQTNIMESGPVLLSSGQYISLPKAAFNDNRHPRTGVCIDSRYTYFITVDGRSNQSYGMNLYEFGKVMKWIGCKEGINLDGGGSTTMYVKDKGVVNMPSDNKLFDHEGERKVNNILIINKK